MVRDRLLSSASSTKPALFTLDCCSILEPAPTYLTLEKPKGPCTYIPKSGLLNPYEQLIEEIMAMPVWQFQALLQRYPSLPLIDMSDEK